MKRILPILALLLCFGAVSAQNPFEKFGYTPKIGTLSKGKYIEHFDTDSIVQIGSVLFNPFTKKITGFVVQETVYSEATLQPEIVSRWLTPDPLADEREWVNPYNFVQNNPILRIDPDGLLDDFHIYADGSIVRQKTDDATDTFIYHDSSGNQHNVATLEKNENGLINAPNISFSGDGVNVNISSKSGNDSEIYISGESLAAVVGASADSNQEVFITRASNSDGSSPGDSRSHVDGKNIDIRFAGNDGSRSPLNFEVRPDDFGKIDLSASSNLNSSLSKFGYKDIRASMSITTHKTTTNGLRTTRSQSSRSIPGTKHLSNHSDHQHLQGFRPNIARRTKQTSVPTITRGIVNF